MIHKKNTLFKVADRKFSIYRIIWSISKTVPKMLYSYIKCKQLTNNRITRLNLIPVKISRLQLKKLTVSLLIFSRFLRKKILFMRVCWKAIFTLNSLYRKIDKLKDNKAIGVDKASSIILKRCKAALTRPLVIIFQKSFSEGVVPYQWTLANVTPIHKKGSRKLRSSYRPVSFSSIICKIFKSILTRVMHGHLVLNILSSIEQHGFVSSKACVNNLLECLYMTKNALLKHRILNVL